MCFDTIFVPSSEWQFDFNIRAVHTYSAKNPTHPQSLLVPNFSNIGISLAKIDRLNIFFMLSNDISYVNCYIELQSKIPVFSIIIQTLPWIKSKLVARIEMRIDVMIDP